MSGPDRQPSDAAVEALARVLFDREWVPGDWRWEQYPQPNRWQEVARAGLEAAYRVDAPRPLLDREQLDELVTYFRAQREGCEQLRAANEETGADLTAIDYHARAETWQSAADAVLTLLNGSES